IGISYGLNYSQSEAIQSTYDKGDGDYKVYIDSLSSSYLEQIITQAGSLNVQGNGRGINYSMGLGIEGLSYKQNNLGVDSVGRWRYFALTPHVLINYSPNRFTHVDFNYSGSTKQP